MSVRLQLDSMRKELLKQEQVLKAVRQDLQVRYPSVLMCDMLNSKCCCCYYYCCCW